MVGIIHKLQVCTHNTCTSQPAAARHPLPLFTLAIMPTISALVYTQYV